MGKVIPYGRQNITDADIAAVVETLKSDFLTQGPKVKEFEDAFAQYVGAKFAVAVTNATAGLHIAVLALGAKTGKKIITSPLTFIASANCALYSGMDVDFVDIDPKTLCIDPVLLEEKIRKSPGDYTGVVLVDFAGFPADLEKIKTITDKYGLWLLEDAAHAPGAEYKDSKGQWQKCGNGIHATASVFSFHPVKHIACGEGGMITTNNEAVYKKLMNLRTHGITRDPAEFVNESHGGWYYEQIDLGFNYRLSDVLCSLGISQLSRMKENIQARRDIADRYLSGLKSLPITLPHVPESSRHAYHLFVIQTDRRRELYDHLKSRGIYAQIHYLPVHKQPYYEARYGKQTFPLSEKYYDRCLSLPMYHSLTQEDQKYVIDTIQEFYG